MRFLVLTQYYAPEIGAAPVRLESMIREIRSLGHEVEVVTAMPNHPTGAVFPEYRGRFYVREDIDGVVVHRVWLYAALGSGLRRIMNYISFALTSLYGLWRSQRPDYIFVESPPLFLSVPGYLTAKRWGAKMVFNVADLWPDSVRELGLMNEGALLKLAEKLERWTYRKADSINAITEGIRRALADKKAVPESKILFLPNGADTELFKPQPPDFKLARSLGIEGKKVVLYAGTHGFAHGIETALHTASLLRERDDIRFVFIGDGSEKKRLIDLTSKLRLTNVKFLEPSAPEMVARLYSLSRIGLSTLRNSALFESTRPVKILSAMSSGVPVLYSGTGEGARLVQDAQAGLVVPPEDVRSLAGAVVALVDNAELAWRFGQNGRRFIEIHLSWSKLVHDWIGQLTERNG